jgi:hypothetical protein
VDGTITYFRESISFRRRFLVFTLDQYVDMDYSLVYFHHGLTSGNKPPLSWLWGLYKVSQMKGIVS